MILSSVGYTRYNYPVVIRTLSITGSWYMDTTKYGVVNKTFQFGKSGDIPVVGDWDGAISVVKVRTMLHKL